MADEMTGLGGSAPTDDPIAPIDMQDVAGAPAVVIDTYQLIMDSKVHFRNTLLRWSILFPAIIPGLLLAPSLDDPRDHPRSTSPMYLKSLGVGLGFGGAVLLGTGLSGTPWVAAGAAAFAVSATGIGLIALVAMALITLAVFGVFRYLEDTEFFCAHLSGGALPINKKSFALQTVADRNDEGLALEQANKCVPDDVATLVRQAFNPPPTDGATVLAFRNDLQAQGLNITGHDDDGNVRSVTITKDSGADQVIYTVKKQFDGNINVQWMAFTRSPKGSLFGRELSLSSKIMEVTIALSPDAPAPD